MISDEAIEAAAEALVGSTLGDRSGIKWEEFFEAARAALKAATPSMMVAAWDEGYTIGNRHDGRRDANPYRAAAERSNDDGN